MSKFGLDNLQLSDPNLYPEFQPWAEDITSRFQILDGLLMAGNTLPFYDSKGRVILNNEGHQLYDTTGVKVVDGETITVRGEDHMVEGTVDTEQIQDGGIYVLGTASVDGPNTLGTTFEEVCGVTITARGYPVLINFHFGGNCNDQGGVYMDWEFRRDSTVLTSGRIYVTNFNPSTDTYIRQFGAVEDDPGTGDFNYGIWMKAETADTYNTGLHRLWVTEAAR